MVTSEPRRRQTEPISKPMIPPPITARRLGTDLSSRAPVEETTVFSLIFKKGSSLTEEPVAITMFEEVTVCFWEEESVGVTEMVFGPVIVA